MAHDIWYNDKCYTKSDYDELKRQEERDAKKAAEEEERAQREEKIESLAAERDTIKTLQFYDDYFFEKFKQFKQAGYSDNSGFGFGDYEDPNFEVQFATSVPLQYDKKCFVYYGDIGETRYIDLSDECILARRNHKSKIHFFNFKKYLPAKSVIKTEDEFLYVFNLYRNIIKIRYTKSIYEQSSFYKRSCYLNAPLTNTETEKCFAEDIQFIRDVVLGKAPRCSQKYPKLYKKTWYEDKQMYFGLVNLCKPDVSVVDVRMSEPGLFDDEW